MRYVALWMYVVGIAACGVISLARGFAAEEEERPPLLRFVTPAVPESLRDTQPAPQSPSVQFLKSDNQSQSNPPKELAVVKEPTPVVAPATAKPLIARSPEIKELVPTGPVTERQTLRSELVPLRTKMRRVLATYEQKQLNTRDNPCWEVMHDLVAFGVKTNIRRGGPDGPNVNAIGWLCWGNRCHNLSLVTVQGNHLFVRIGPDVQGHPGQFLGMLAQSRVRTDYPIEINGKHFTVADLIEEEKLDCRSGTELTFKLIALTHYLPSNATWQSRYGDYWDIPRLVREEIAAPINGVTCGGTHRLYGLSSAYKMREFRGESIDGEYARAKKYVMDYQKYTLTKLQNSDGSLSTDWFKQPGDRNDVERKLQTTGHMLEWLVWSLTPEQLEHPRTVKTVEYLTNLLYNNPSHKWYIGSLGHALHALVIYDERVFQQYDEPSADDDEGNFDHAAQPVVRRPKS